MSSFVFFVGWLFQVVFLVIPEVSHSSTGRLWQDHDQVLRTRRTEFLIWAYLVSLVSSWRKDREMRSEPPVSAS